MNWVVVYRMAGSLVIVLLTILMASIFMPKCRSFREFQRRKATIEEEARTLEARIRKLQMQQEQFQCDRAFVERAARELGMAKPGEIVFKVSREEARPAPPGGRRKKP